MQNYKDIFYTYNLEEIEKLKKLRPQLEALKYVPENCDPSFVSILEDDNPIKILRETLFLPPNEKEFLKTEAKTRMLKDLKSNDGNQSQDSEFDKGWAYRKGYISWPANAKRHQALQNCIANFFNYDSICTGDFLYPEQGFRSWHTNKFDLAGWTMFIVLSSNEAESYFQFIDPDTEELIKIRENDLSLNFFQIKTQQPFWHSILNEKGLRWSVGFSIPHNWQSFL